MFTHLGALPNNIYLQVPGDELKGGEGEGGGRCGAQQVGGAPAVEALDTLRAVDLRMPKPQLNIKKRWRTKNSCGEVVHARIIALHASADLPTRLHTIQVAHVPESE